MKPFSLVGEDVIEQLVKMAGETPEGSFVEVGVYKGGTAKPLADKAKEQGRKIFLYDTFEGIPHQGEFDSIAVGTFSDTDLGKIKGLIPHAYIGKGIFPESSFRKEMFPISFVHLDCDQYQSYKEAIPHLLRYSQRGTVLWFDDYGYLHGATKAVEEFFNKDQLQICCGKTFVRI